MKKYRAIQEFTLDILDDEDCGTMTVFEGSEFEFSEEQQHRAEGELFLQGENCWITISRETLEELFEEI